jgi:hypothetical protein
MGGRVDVVLIKAARNPSTVTNPAAERVSAYASVSPQKYRNEATSPTE